VLRVLQENKIQRVGSEKEIEVNVRVIAATNKDLLKEIEENRFRLDLYHRLSVILIHTPALREHKEDIPLLVNSFLENIAKDYGQPVKKINKDAMKALQNHAWKGNIRELRNVVERLMILGGNPINVEDVQNYVLANSK